MIPSKINALPTPLRAFFVSALLGLPILSTAAEKAAGHVQAALVAEDLRASAGGDFLWNLWNLGAVYELVIDRILAKTSELKRFSIGEW